MNTLNRSLSRFFTLGAAAVTLGFLSGRGLRAEDAREPVLPTPLCDNLDVPDGNTLKFHAYAAGVQIYRWDGASWVFIAPMANLFADPGYHGKVGIHFAGPTWQTKSGSFVVGRKIGACAPDPTAIPWLLLAGAASDGPGVLDGVTYVQRLNTAGGLAPAGSGQFVGQEADVPYTAEYFFYTAE
jgi:hypothetical protein